MIIVGFLILGFFAGGLGGLLGLGGGTIVVPALAAIFHYEGIPAYMIFHLAVGTSFAIMIVTSAVSAWARARQKNILWPVVWRLLPGLLLGVVLGSLLASHLPTVILKIGFAIFLLLIALRMLFLSKLKPSRQLPGNKVLLAVGSAAGVLSGLLGVGIGAVSVPYLTRHNVDMPFASGIASFCTVPLAMLGTVSFLVTGWHLSHVSYNIGYVDWLAFLLVGVTSVLTAPFAAKLSTRLKTKMLKRIFAIFLLIIAAGLIWGL